MRVSQETVSAIEKIVTGNEISADERLAPYQSGPDLVAFFNQFGDDDTYGQGFPSRWAYAEDKIRQHNGTQTLPKVIEAALDPRRFLGSDFMLRDAVLYLNNYLKLDGYKLRRIGDFYRVRKRSSNLVQAETPLLDTGEPNLEFIQEQLSKCNQKIADQDYDGAITNARALLEAVLLELEQRLDDSAPEHDGDLIRLYKRLQKQLNIDPARKDISNSLKQILGGLTSIVHGLSSVRNRMSDAHARKYRPHRHHAKLAVNSAVTAVDFLLSSYDYQLKNGMLESPSE